MMRICAPLLGLLIYTAVTMGWGYIMGRNRGSRKRPGKTINLKDIHLEMDPLPDIDWEKIDRAAITPAVLAERDRSLKILKGMNSVLNKWAMGKSPDVCMAVRDIRESLDAAMKKIKKGCSPQ